MPTKLWYTIHLTIVSLIVPVTPQNTEQLGDSFGVNPLDTNRAIDAHVKRQIGYSFVKAWIETQLPTFIKNIAIPDNEKKTFWYSYGFTGANITDFTTPSISVLPSGNDVIAKATGGHISAKGNYQIRLTFFKTSGTVTVTIKDVSITLRGNYDNQVRIKSCSGSIGSLQVTLSGKLLNLFRKHLEQPFRHAIQSKFPSTIIAPANRVGSHVVSVRIHCTEKWRTSFHTDVLSKTLFLDKELFLMEAIIRIEIEIRKVEEQE